MIVMITVFSNFSLIIVMFILVARMLTIVAMTMMILSEDEENGDGDDLSQQYSIPAYRHQSWMTEHKQ